jgi:preprotein translocase subunit SecG
MKKILSYAIMCFTGTAVASIFFTHTVYVLMISFFGLCLAFMFLGEKRKK